MPFPLLPSSTLFPYTTLFRSRGGDRAQSRSDQNRRLADRPGPRRRRRRRRDGRRRAAGGGGEGGAQLYGVVPEAGAGTAGGAEEKRGGGGGVSFFSWQCAECM